MNQHIQHLKLKGATIVISIILITAFAISLDFTIAHIDESIFWAACAVTYMLGVAFSVSLSHISSKFDMVLSIVLLPLMLLNVFASWIKLAIILQFVVVCGASMILLALRVFRELGLFSLPENLCYYIAFTLSACLSTSEWYGNKIISLTHTKVFFEKLKVNSYYETSPIRFSIYTAYFCFLSYDYYKMFYNDQYETNSVILASFVTYLAFDRIVGNFGLIESLKDNTIKNFKNFITGQWTR